MKRSTSHKVALAILSLVIGAAFVLVYGMLRKRVDSGENYPAYSSLRPDPQGTRVFFEALDRLQGVEAERNFLRLRRLDGRLGRTFLFAGVSVNGFNFEDETIPEDAARLAVEGSRVVFTLDSSSIPTRLWRNLERAERELEKEQEEARKKKLAEEKKNSSPATQPAKPKETSPVVKDKPQPPKPATKEKAKEDKKADPDDEALEAFLKRTSLAEQLKLRIDAPRNGNMEEGGVPTLPVVGTELAGVELPRWRTLATLDDDQSQEWERLRQDGLRGLSRKIDEVLTERERDAERRGKNTAPPPKPPVPDPSPWKTLATALGKPVIMERKLGQGSVVVCTDRYFLSNEALWKDNHPAFLSWLVGNASEVIFEETHLGSSIGDGEGIMTLARQYRMHGLFVGGMLFFILFVWRSVTSLVPHDPDADLGYWRQDAVAGQSAASGLEGMLRRGIRLEQLMKRALSAWQGTPAAAKAVPAERLVRANAEAEQARSFKTFPEYYRRIRDILHPPRKN